MIDVLDEATAREHLASLDTDDLFTSATWLSVIADSYGMSLRAVCDRRSGATLPFVLVDDLAGQRLISLPFSDYVKLPHSLDRLLDLGEAALDSHPTFSMSIRPAGPPPGSDERNGWEIKPMAVYHRLAPADEATLWRGLSQSFRNQVRQGQRRSLTVHVDRSRLAVDRFYSLHTLVRNRKFASIPQPRRFFHLIHDRYFTSEQGFILEIWDKDAVVAGCLVLRHRDSLYYKFSASLPEAEPVRANNLMLWELLRYASSRGLALDLGRSGLGAHYAGLRHFKNSLGAASSVVLSVDHPPRRPDPHAAERAAKFAVIAGKLSRLLASSRLDEAGNDAAAELLYRFFA